MDVAGAVRWSAASAWGGQAIQFVISIVLARILLPQDYGLLAMAVVFIGFLSIFTTMGFGPVVIQRREVSNSLLNSLYYATVVFAGCMAIVTTAAAPLCAWIYRDPRVMSVMAALGISFLLSAPGVIPSAQLNRQMKFGRIAVAELASVVINGAVAISLAVTGWGVWALVIGSQAGATTGTVLYHVLAHWRPRLIFHLSEVRIALNFGANVTGFSVVNYFARNADQFIIGAFLGAGPLGFYSLAYGIMLKPRDAVTGMLMRVLFPAFSRMQDDDERLKAAYLRACGAIAFVTFPMMLGLLAVAQPFVQVVLGEKWLPAVPLICLFAPLGAIQSVWSGVGNVFLAKGRADWYFRWGAAGATLFICSFLAGLPWGIFGVALSYTLTCAIWSVVSFWIAFKLVNNLSVWDLAKTLQIYAVGAGAMALLVMLCRFALVSLSIAQPVVLLACIAVGVVSYAMIAFVLWPPAAADLLRLTPKPLAALIRRLKTRLRPADQWNCPCRAQEQSAGSGRVAEIAPALPVPESPRSIQA
jgi:PST family polysaccharide transporter